MEEGEIQVKRQCRRQLDDMRNGVRVNGEDYGKVDLRKGDLLISTGMGGVFPPGYPVASVSKVERTAKVRAGRNADRHPPSYSPGSLRSAEASRYAGKPGAPGTAAHAAHGR